MEDVEKSEAFIDLCSERFGNSTMKRRVTILDKPKKLPTTKEGGYNSELNAIEEIKETLPV